VPLFLRFWRWPVKPKGSGKLVWSSERPVEKPMAGKTDAPAREPWRSLPPKEQDVRVRRESKGRGGKTVTVAAPLVLTRDDASRLLGDWKRLCGGGGALKASKTPAGDPCFELEIQGDHADRIVAELVKAGYRAKRSGG
jgi:translation initiation factor 1